jgi:hypothetical protein
MAPQRTLQSQWGAVVKLLRTPEDIVQALAELQDARDVSCETIDDIAGWAPGYGAKLRVGMKGFGRISLPLWLESLGVALVLVEDSAAIERVSRRWQKRKRPPVPKK